MSGPSNSQPPAQHLPRHLRGVALPDGADVDRLRARYGADRSPIGVVVVAALVVIPFLGWVVWAGLEQANPDLRWETIGYSEVSDESVTIDFEVYLPDGASAECTVRALDSYGVEVGRADVPVRAEGSSTSVDYALAVTARPSSAFVESCRLIE